MKVGLVLEGGGVRGAYTAGALKWLNDHQITFDYGVGISSGALYLCLYWQKETKIPYDLATYYATQKDIVGLSALLKEGHYVAYRKLFEDSLKKKAGMNIDSLIDQKANIEVGVYELEDGYTKYVAAKDMDHEMEILLAACALPIASSVVEYQGKHLLDGGITKMIPIEQAMTKNLDRYFVITTKPKGYTRKPASKLVRFMMKLFYRQYPQVEKDYQVRHLNYEKQMNLIYDLEEKKQAFLIQPSMTIPVSRWKGDPENTKKLYQLGYDDMEKRKQEIFDFLDIQ